MQALRSNARVIVCGLMLPLTGCVKLPFSDNSGPGRPDLSNLPADCSSTVPCGVAVTGSDPDGERLAYQLEIADTGPYSEGPALTFWSSFYPSGEAVVFFLLLHEGVYSVRARARDPMGEASAFSNAVTVVSNNAAPYISEAPQGDTLLFTGCEATFRAQAVDVERNDVSLRYDPGNGEPLSEWSPLQTMHDDYVFRYAYPAAGFFGLRVQARDHNGNNSSWSPALSVEVRENVTMVGSCEIPTGAVAVAVRASYAYVASYILGLQVVDLSIPEDPRVVGNWGAFSASAIRHNGDAVFILEKESSTIHSFDVSSPTLPRRRDRIEISGAQVFDVEGDLAVVGTEWPHKGISLVDVSDPDSMRVTSHLALEEPTDVALHRPYAYLTFQGGPGGQPMLSIVDVSDPETPQLAGSSELPGYGPICIGPAGYVFVASSQHLEAVLVADPAAPRLAGQAVLDSRAVDLHYASGRLAVADGYGFLVFDVSVPESAARIAKYDPPGSCQGVWCEAEYMYVALRPDGLLIFSYPRYVQSTDSGDDGRRADHAGVLGQGGEFFPQASRPRHYQFLKLQ